MRQSRTFFARKKKPTGYFFIPAYQFSKAIGYMEMIMCLNDDIIDYASWTKNYINTHELYNHCPHTQVKDTTINVINIALCVRSAISVTLLFKI